LNIFPKGIINIHPSLLPKYRGPTPVQTAILNGDNTTGLTIIKLDEQVDHGPILAQRKEPILENDTAESLYERLFKLSASSIVSTIELYLKGKIELRKQNHAKATFTKRLSREDGHIDLQNPPAKEIFDRMIRAYDPWPGVWTKWKMENGKWKIVKFLPEKKIQVEGKKLMSYKDFVNGYPEAKDLIKKLT
jgi:methionyl-tRNA formyltransferase